MKACVCISEMGDGASIAAAASRAAAAGFDGVEIAVSQVGGAGLEATEEECRSLAATVEKTGVRIAAVSAEGLSAEDLRIAETGRDRPFWGRVSGIVDLAGWLGAESVVVRAEKLGAIGGEGPRAGLELVHSRAMEVLLGVRGRAERRAIQVACLHGSAGMFRSPLEARRFIDEINSPWVGVCLNLGEIAADEAVEWMDLLGHRVAQVRLGDTVLTCGILMKQTVAALRRVRYDGWVAFQGDKEWREAAERLRGEFKMAKGE